MKSDAYNQLAGHLNNKRFEQGEDFLNKLIESGQCDEDNVDARFFRHIFAFNLYPNKRKEIRKSIISQAFEEPAHINLIDYMGQLEMQLPQDERSSKIIRRWLQFHPKNQLAWAHLYNDEVQRQQSPLALYYASQLLRHSTVTNNDLIEKRAGLYVQNGKGRLALAHLKRISKKHQFSKSFLKSLINFKVNPSEYHLVREILFQEFEKSYDANKPLDEVQLNGFFVLSSRQKDYADIIKFFTKFTAKLKNKTHIRKIHYFLIPFMARDERLDLAKQYLDATNAQLTKDDLQDKDIVKEQAFAQLYYFIGKEDHEKASGEYDRLQSIEANDLNQLSDWSNYLTKQEFFFRSLAVADQYARYAPDNLHFLVNQAFIYSMSNLPAYGIALAYRAIKLYPDNIGAHRNAIFSLLTVGRFDEGFEEFDWRWKFENDGNQHAIDVRKAIPKPHLTSEHDVKDKKVVLYFEQGLGDCIHFLRYADELKERGALPVIFVTKKYLPLLPLVKTREDDFEVVGPEGVFKRIDYECSLLDLPRILNTQPDTIPPPRAWPIQADRKAKWNKIMDRLGVKKNKPVIGVVYEGGVLLPRNKKRSIGLQKFLPFFDYDAEFIILQKEIQDKDRPVLDYYDNVYLINEELGDFLDTATALEWVDMVISVDTSVAHLAGTQGIPTAVLLTYRNDWRWGYNERDSSWYPSVKIYSQPAGDDWDGALYLLNADLRDYLYDYSQSKSGKKPDLKLKSILL